MRILILSDLHLEFGPWRTLFPPADVVVLAGDIHTKTNGLYWAAEMFPNTPVIYVAGNHEYYGTKVPSFTEELRHAGRHLGIHFLERDAITIDDVTFLGCTLWTDLELTGHYPSGVNAAREAMTDYRQVRVEPTYRRLSPTDTARWHAESMGWLRTHLGPAPSSTVVVTHHAPSAKSLGSLAAGGDLSASYASNLDELVSESGAALWIHGHTHVCVDYMLGKTRVVSNQRGYPDPLAVGFDPGFIVTL